MVTEKNFQLQSDMILNKILPFIGQKWENNSVTPSLDECMKLFELACMTLCVLEKIHDKFIVLHLVLKKYKVVTFYPALFK